MGANKNEKIGPDVTLSTLLLHAAAWNYSAGQSGV